jgi:membrane protein required for colicin V production
MNIAVLVDIGIVAVLLISAGVSFFRGFIREILTIVGVLGGGFAALSFGSSVIPITSGWFGIESGKDAGELFGIIPMELAAQIAAYGGIFLIVFIILQLASYLISRAVQAVGLGPVDRTLGIFFGLARGLLLLGVLYLPFHFILPEDSKKEWFENSKAMIFVQATTDWLTSFVPENKGEKKDEKSSDETRDKLNAIDILGDKRLNKDELKKKAEDAIGYTDKARQGLENLIEDKTDATGKNNND